MHDSNWTGEEPFLRVVDLHKSYFRGSEVQVLRGVDFDVRQGEVVSVVGSSGSGKSTLLHLLGTLDQPTSGSIHWQGKRIDDQPSQFRDRFRNEVVGFVFQFYHLLPELSALENVMLPAMVRFSVMDYFRKRSSLRKQATDLLERVGLSHRMHHRPTEMSGGEMQRAAIARALLGRPQILLADEPTGNLDAETGEGIIQLLFEIRREIDLTVVLVTHNQQIADQADRTLKLVQGRIEELPVSCG